MATYFRLLDVGRQFFDSNGDPLNGGKLYTYEAGTTTNKATYQDDAGGAAHANPIVLDSAGRVPAEVWGTTGAYNLKLDTSAGSTIWTADDIVGINDSEATDASEWVPSGLTPTYVGATQFSFAGDQTTIYHVRRRVKITDGGGTKYATITASSYSAPNTTITVRVDSGGSLSSPVTAVQHGLISANNTSSPSLKFVSGSYTGDGATSLAITGIGFTPKYVKIAQRRTTDASAVPIWETWAEVMDDNASGGTLVHVDSGASPFHTFNTNAIISLDSDGFTVDDDGVDQGPNASGIVYNYFCLG